MIARVLEDDEYRGDPRAGETITAYTSVVSAYETVSFDHDLSFEKSHEA